MPKFFLERNKRDRCTYLLYCTYDRGLHWVMCMIPEGELDTLGLDLAQLHGEYDAGDLIPVSIKMEVIEDDN